MKNFEEQKFSKLKCCKCGQLILQELLSISKQDNGSFICPECQYEINRKEKDD